MDVRVTHHVEEIPGNPPGCESRYEYDLYFFFSNEGPALVARSYVQIPEEAHFLRIESNGRMRALTLDDLRGPLFSEAKRYLAELGKHELTWLSGNGNGYEPIA